MAVASFRVFSPSQSSDGDLVQRDVRLLKAHGLTVWIRGTTGGGGGGLFWSCDCYGPGNRKCLIFQTNFDELLVSFIDTPETNGTTLL